MPKKTATEKRVAQAKRTRKLRKWALEEIGSDAKNMSPAELREAWGKYQDTIPKNARAIEGNLPPMNTREFFPDNVLIEVPRHIALALLGACASALTD